MHIELPGASLETSLTVITVNIGLYNKFACKLNEAICFSDRNFTENLGKKL